VEHTKTGNPLVDSVAEHQAASPEAYIQYLHDVTLVAPVGFGIVAFLGCTPSSSFLLLYGITAYFFSHKMVRLILLTAPIASICGGIAMGYTWAWMVGAIFGDERPSLHYLIMGDEEEDEEIAEIKVEATPTETTAASSESNKANNGKNSSISKSKKAKTHPKQEEQDKTAGEATATIIADEATTDHTSSSGDPLWARAIRLVVSYLIVREVIPRAQEFHEKSHQMAQAISHPTILTKGSNRNTGEEIIMDDYREAYWWLRDNTPEDARIMAWWDYGYQITGIANRTTIADGNTWNHEHIALLGRALTSPEKEGHRIARHLADYVLIWAGGGGDDLAKSPHLIRIANSVYRGLCKEPTCRSFGMTVGAF
jgi:dolichyl-diphosphooligosaccharide--protein glycosyltransferase